MSNILYHIGFDKDNILFFSKESNVFLVLRDILNKVNNNYYLKMKEMESFKVEGLQDIQMILLELKKYLSNNIEGLMPSYDYDSNEYINYLKEIKKELLGKRDAKSKEIRSLIKLYVTLRLYVLEKREVEFLTHDSNEIFTW